MEPKPPAPRWLSSRLAVSAQRAWIRAALWGAFAAAGAGLAGGAVDLPFAGGVGQLMFFGGIILAIVAALHFRDHRREARRFDASMREHVANYCLAG